jgi:hypothetical protein
MAGFNQQPTIHQYIDSQVQKRTQYEGYSGNTGNGWTQKETIAAETSMTYIADAIG